MSELEPEGDDEQDPPIAYEASVEGIAAFAGEVAKAVATVGGGDPFAAAQRFAHANLSLND
jgi:hypothetical protein